MSIAVYAGTFDPVTRGHLALIREAARIFAQVRVLVAVNPDKQATFSLAERVEMIGEAIKKMPQVSVDATEGLVVDYAREIGASFLIRGVRTTLDADFELQLAHENRRLAPEATTIFLPADLAFASVSSSDARRAAREGPDLDPLVTPAVAERLRHRYGS